jgi:hypothetical protein
MCAAHERLTALDALSFLVMSQQEWTEEMFECVEYL